jgi:hypothetical protein
MMIDDCFWPLVFILFLPSSRKNSYIVDLRIREKP